MSTKKSFFALLMTLMYLGASTTGCAVPKSRAAENVKFTGSGEQGGKITQTELQQDLQRFTAGFLERIAQAYGVLNQSKSDKIAEEGLRRTLLYATSVLDIVSSPNPEVGLLDMLVFVTLSRETLDDYWIPKLFKKDGEIMSIAFARSEPEIWAIADKVMNPTEQATVKKLIAEWKSENPGQTRVEGVRLSDFSRKAGEIAADKAATSGGLIASVASGVQTADQALLMANRVLFMAQRLPFLIRMHAALGAGEVLSSVSTKFEPGGALAGTLGNADSIAGKAVQAAHESRLLAESLYPLILPKKGKLPQYLASGDSIAGKVITILDKLNAVTPQAVSRLDGIATRVLLYLFLVGVAIAAVWWTGYYLVKKRLLALAPRPAPAIDEHRKAA